MESGLLSLRGLSIDLVRGAHTRRILDGVDLDIASDRVIGVLGESGSGKTTLARSMVGWVASPLRVVSGEALYRGRSLFDPEAQRQARARIGFIGADPGNAFDPTMTVGRQIVEKLRAVRPEVNERQAHKRVVDLLDAVRIPSAARRFDEYPNQYSGGMLQRAVIVDAMVTDPELLICDNIIQPLDVTVAAQIVRLLRELRGRLSAGIVFISTSVPSLAEVADETVVLAGGRIVERGSATQIARAPREAVTKEMVARTPRIWTGESVAAPQEHVGQPILQVSDVTKTYRTKDRTKLFGHQNVQAVRGVSFEVFKGDNFGLASPAAASQRCRDCCPGSRRRTPARSCSTAATSRR